MAAPIPNHIHRSPPSPGGRLVVSIRIEDEQRCSANKFGDFFGGQLACSQMPQNAEMFRMFQQWLEFTRIFAEHRREVNVIYQQHTIAAFFPFRLCQTHPAAIVV